jgi:hypothetical protein
VANEIQIQSATGRTVYGVIFRDSDQQVYNGSGFEVLDGDNWGDYDVALTEVGTTGIYRADFPVAITVTYSVMMYWQQAGSPATSDVLIGVQAIGKNAVTLAAADVTGNLPADVTDKTGFSLLSTGLDLVTAWTVGITGNITGNLTGTIGGLSQAAIAQFFLTDSGELYGDAVAGSVVKEIADNAAGGGLDAAGVRSAIGLASANLDTQLSAIDTVVDGIKATTDQFVFTVANQVDANALSGAGGLDAAGVRAAVGLASANLDTQLSTIDGVVDDILTDTGTTLPGTLVTIDGKIDAIDLVVDAILVDTDTTIPNLISGLNNISAADVWDLVNGIETGFTPRESMRLIAAATAGKVSGAETTTNTFRSLDDSEDRIVATVDADGNRTAITYDKG